MGVVCLVLGHSGSGKSYSLRNFGENDVGVLNVTGKRFPFRNKLQSFDHATYPVIKDALKANKRNAYVIEDANYLMQFANFREARNKGYDKFVGFAVDFESMLEAAMQTNDNTITYVIMHVDYDDGGNIKPKTIGKMLDSQFTIEGIVPIVLLAYGDDSGYHFLTNDPNSIVKSPPGMFEQVINNDLKAVDTAIREFWDMEPIGGAE